MGQSGDVFINPVTGERAVVRVSAEESGGALLMADLYLRPGAAVVGEHVHPTVEEKFTVVRGRVSYKLNGQSGVAGAGDTILLPAGVAHDWWNSGAEEAMVRFEIKPGARFQEMIMNIFGLAQDGKTDRRGLPNLLQLAVFAREFSDVVVFTKPSPAVQRLIFGALAPLAWLLGYRGSYVKYQTREPSSRVELEPIG